MFIETMPEVLTWSAQGADVMKRVHYEYVSLVSDRLGERLAEIVQFDRTRGDVLLHLLKELTDEGFLRFLTAPEMTYRLLWPAQHWTESTMCFIEEALKAELACINRFRPCEGSIWTPN